MQSEMSSEDSEVEAGDEIIVVKKLPWRSDPSFYLDKASGGDLNHKGEESAHYGTTTPPETPPL